MPILEKCSKCKREGGYCKTTDSKVCARCVAQAKEKAGEHPLDKAQKEQSKR